MTVLRRNSLVLSSRVCIGHAIAEQLIVEPNGSVDERLQASSFRPDRGSHGGCARTSARVPRRTGGRSAPLDVACGAHHGLNDALSNSHSQNMKTTPARRSSHFARRYSYEALRMVSSERGRRARDQTHCFEHNLLRSAVGGSSYPADTYARWRLRCQASCC